MAKKRSTEQTLESKYQKVFSVRKRFEGDIENIIKGIISAGGHKAKGITSRTKEVPSFIAKANKPKQEGTGKKYKNPLLQITDITGIRVIFEYKDDARKAADSLRSKLIIDSDNCRDTAFEYGESEFGYSAIHLVCSITKEIEEEYSCQAIQGWKFEVQIRTELEDAWARKSRDFFYDKSIDTQHKRELNRLAALLEIADKEFIELRDKVGRPIDATVGNMGSDQDTMSVEDTLSIIKDDPSVEEIISRLAQDGLKINDTVRDEHMHAISMIFSRQGAQSKEKAKRILKDSAKNIAYAGKLFMKAAGRQSHNRDTLFIPALAITGNGDIQPEDYCIDWYDSVKKAFITAAQQYNYHISNK